ncbi:NCS2 family permease [Rubeoparvulum massiliense]|uniref:NCS2 family permease n=1 Tax=Rubeoparvulum massiliense TaxID=1631346 RepID=UPI00065E40BD|nr:NCS2 family permease [Rubeoparvulum massiliense]
MKKYFEFEKFNTNYRQESVAGLTTFLAMAYILFVNPNFLSATGMDRDSVFVATALAAAAGTLVMGLWAKYPVALAPGMGLNAFFAFTVVLGMGIPWQQALAGVFVSGFVFFILTLTKVRETIINAIPAGLKLAAAAGIGLFIAFIGFQNAGLIVDNPATLVGIGHLNVDKAVDQAIGMELAAKQEAANLALVAETGDAAAVADPVTLTEDELAAATDAATTRVHNTWLSIFGLVISALLMIRNVKGGIFYGMIVTSVVGMIFGLIQAPTSVSDFVQPIPSIAPTFGVIFDPMFSAEFWSSSTMWMVIFTFLFVDFFDTAGTLMGVASQAGLLVDNKLPRAGKALAADSIATMVGALFGTSTTTSYVESSAGVAAGGRTGFASVVTAGLFLLALFFSPMLNMITAAVTAPALILVGVLMASNLGKVAWSQLEEAVPAFLTIILMPLTYSIATGIACGFIVYPLTMIFRGKAKEVHPIMYGLFIIFILYFTFLGN